jgi:phosphoribosylaminoimidazole-succinocarboxamide synthase
LHAGFWSAILAGWRGLLYEGDQHRSRVAIAGMGWLRPEHGEREPMARRKMIYEGKAKILYEGPEPGTIVQYFKDDATAFNAEKKDVIDGKGVLNNRLSEYFMTGLGAIGVPTHFLKRLNMREQLVRSCEIIPLEIIVRNYAAGSMSKRLGIEEGTQLPRPIVEYCYKDDSLGDPLVSEEHIAAFGWASQQDMDDILSLALRVNDFMAGVMFGVGIRLVDFKIEIGRVFDGDFQRLVVADEISPDSCRLWDIETGRKLDKDVVRRDLGDLSDAYAEVARRLGVLPQTQPTKPTLVN